MTLYQVQSTDLGPGDAKMKYGLLYIVVGAVIFGAAWEECVRKGSHFKVLPNTVFKDSREIKVLVKMFWNGPYTLPSHTVPRVLFLSFCSCAACGSSFASLSAALLPPISGKEQICHLWGSPRAHGAKASWDELLNLMCETDSMPSIYCLSTWWVTSSPLKFLIKSLTYYV